MTWPRGGQLNPKAASGVGFAAADSLHAVRVEGENRPGGGARLLGKLGKAGLNVRGFSAAAIGKRYIAYIALDTPEDAAKAMKLLAGS